jgi:signal transduction histidine kinase
MATMEERQRLARDLHDSVTQSLYSLTLLAEAGRRHAERGNLERTQHHLERLGATAQQALKEMRLLVYELRPLELEGAGLASALRQRLEAVEHRSGVEARLLLEGALDLPVAIEEGLYRVAQEALNNALKHAQATHVTISVRADGERAELTVADDGRGFDREAVRDRGGLGLVGMRERAERLGGTLTVEAAPGTGTTIRLSLPIGGSASVPRPSALTAGEV